MSLAGGVEASSGPLVARFPVNFPLGARSGIKGPLSSCVLLPCVLSECGR
jgi:hypothetical protein